MGGVTLTICTTCRARGGAVPDASEETGDAPRPGAALHAALAARDLPEGVRLRAVECLSACARGCTAALSGGPDRWAYVYGDLDPARDLAALLEGAALYAATPDGLIPWRARPAIFRKQCVARLPPQQD